MIASQGIRVERLLVASREGERALRSLLLWTRIPIHGGAGVRPSSCTPPAMRVGQRFLAFGDVAADGRAFVTVCNLIPLDSLTPGEREELREMQLHGLRCR